MWQAERALAESGPSATAESSHPLASHLDRIADELQLVRQVLDELRTDFQWAVQNGRLRVEHSDHEAVSGSPLTLFDEGDAVEFWHEGKDCFGEIIAIDDARNRATVLLIPSNETVSVLQDELTRVEPDERRGQPDTVVSTSETLTNVETTAIPTDREMPAPGNLF